MRPALGSRASSTTDHGRPNLKLASILLALLALAFGLVVAGCGDDDEDEPQALTSGATGATGADGGEALTTAAFIEAADEICKQGNSEIETEGSDFFSEERPTDAEATEFVEEIVLPSLQEQHDAIAALAAPESEQDAVEDVLAKLQAGIDEIEDDPAAFVKAGENSPVFDEANAGAKDLGLKVCGEG